MTYRELLNALKTLPDAQLDRPVTAHFHPPTEPGPMIFPIRRIGKAGDLLAGHKSLPMYGADLPLLSGNRP